MVDFWVSGIWMVTVWIFQEVYFETKAEIDFNIYQVVSVFREGECRDLSTVTFEVGDVLLLKFN